MIKAKITIAMFSLALMVSPAFAQDFVDAKIQELSSQGYTHFEVSRGWMRSEIEAYGPNLTKLEVQLSNADGSVVSQRTEIQSQVDYDENVREISQTNSNVRNEADDDTDDAIDDTDLDDEHGGNDSDGNDNDGNDNGGNDSDGNDNDRNNNDGNDNDGNDNDDD